MIGGMTGMYVGGGVGSVVEFTSECIKCDICAVPSAMAAGGTVGATGGAAVVADGGSLRIGEY